MNLPTAEDVKKLVADTKVVGEAAASVGDHKAALQALLSAYCTIASAHPCCIQLHGLLLCKAGEALLSEKLDAPKHSVH